MGISLLAMSTRPWLKSVSHWTPQHFTLSVRALINRRMAGSGWMISYLSAYLCSLLVIYLIHSILLSRGGWPLISINSSIALRIAAYKIYMNVSRGLPSLEAVLQTQGCHQCCRSCKFF